MRRRRRDINNNNKLSYEAKKNYKTDSTELYDISYQYKIDCLTAGLVFRREFYTDNEILSIYFYNLICKYLISYKKENYNLLYKKKFLIFFLKS